MNSPSRLQSFLYIQSSSSKLKLNLVSQLSSRLSCGVNMAIHVYACYYFLMAAETDLQTELVTVNQSDAV